MQLIAMLYLVPGIREARKGLSQAASFSLQRRVRLAGNTRLAVEFCLPCHLLRYVLEGIEGFS